ncbi:glycosyltransferase [Roseovarius sp. B08]|uniref:glycosyltransferase n=1 Tax=Roseovarius sp. B08 TaxID=3449223 RepID=UPI003EDC149D
MRPAPAKDTAIVIPARNEEKRIAHCLNALAEQCSARVVVIVVVNNSTDSTVARARDAALRLGLDLTVLQRRLEPHEGVGTARRIGCDHALQHIPALRYLLTTDADCIVAPQWLARNLAHLETSDAVCGKVEPIAVEADILDGVNPQFVSLESTYRKLVQEIYAGHAQGCADVAGTHGEAAGASLAFSKSGYLAAGGFAPIPCGEDRRIVRALRSARRRVRHADDVTVQASCRLSGRASGGMSDTLRSRIGASDYLVDDCLPPADWLVSHVERRSLDVWPPQVPARLRFSVRDLPRHIERLDRFRNSERSKTAAMAPATALPDSHSGGLQPDKASVNILADVDLQANWSMRPLSCINSNQRVGRADRERSPG